MDDTIQIDNVNILLKSLGEKDHEYDGLDHELLQREQMEETMQFDNMNYQPRKNINLINKKSETNACDQFQKPLIQQGFLSHKQVWVLIVLLLIGAFNYYQMQQELIKSQVQNESLKMNLKQIKARSNLLTIIHRVQPTKQQKIVEHEKKQVGIWYEIVVPNIIHQIESLIKKFDF